MSQEGGDQIFSARRYFNIDTVIQGDFKWHTTYIPTWYALYRVQYARHTEPYLPSNAIILPEIVFTDKVINQRCSRVCYLYCIKKHETSSLQSSCSKSVNQEWFLACDVMAVFTDPCPFEGDSSSQGRSEHMQPGASVNHNCTVPLFVPLFTSVPLLFIFFF